MLGFLRQLADNLVLVIVNLSEQNFTGHSYGVRTGGRPHKELELCPKTSGGGPGDTPGGPWCRLSPRIPRRAAMIDNRWSVSNTHGRASSATSSGGVHGALESLPVHTVPAVQQAFFRGVTDGDLVGQVADPIVLAEDLTRGPVA